MYEAGPKCRQNNKKPRRQQAFIGFPTPKGWRILAQGEERSDVPLGSQMSSLYHPTGVVQKPPHVPDAHVLHHPCMVEVSGVRGT